GNKIRMADDIDRRGTAACCEGGDATECVVVLSTGCTAVYGVLNTQRIAERAGAHELELAACAAVFKYRWHRCTDANDRMDVNSVVAVGDGDLPRKIAAFLHLSKRIVARIRCER